MTSQPDPFAALDKEDPLFQEGEVVASAYEIRSLLGHGGMGEVYEAHDRVLNRRVALKVARPNVGSEHLLLEGRALAAIRHSGVVTVHTIGHHRGFDFLVLELVQGLSLDKMIDDRRSRGEVFSVGETLDLLVAVADALAVVHQAGLVHRDVKPGNVMLAPGGRVVLMDFGLVLPHSDRSRRGSVAGSVQYMAPEALVGDVSEGAGDLGDVYGLGVLGYELLTGLIPYENGEPADVYHTKTRYPVPLVTDQQPDVPMPLCELVAQLMAVDPQERPQGAEAALWQLRAMQMGHKRAAQGDKRQVFTALIVDDDPDMREALSLYVKAGAPDAVIETTGNGTEAIRAVRRRVPNLMLLDLDLPDINGVEVCMTLRGMDLGAGCRIISVSGRATQADVELLQQLGVRLLEKGPRLMPELVGIVERMQPGARAPSR